MNSVLNEIIKLRDKIPITIVYKNSNRYQIVVHETNGTKTAYYFSTPIYNGKTRKVVDMKFSKQGNIAYVVGSNAQITISNEIHMENGEGYLRIPLKKEISKITKREILYNQDVIMPTTNGIVYKGYIKEKTKICFELEINIPFMNISANNKYFSFMCGQFRPFATVSYIGTSNASGNMICPAEISYKKTH